MMEIRRTLWTDRAPEMGEILSPGYTSVTERVADVVVDGKELRILLTDGTVLYQNTLEGLAWELILGGAIQRLVKPCPRGASPGG
jgi:hypothetical protein